MQKWEYITSSYQEELFGVVGPMPPDDVLNHYGQEGWELVSAATVKTFTDTPSNPSAGQLVVVRFFFKRPLQQPVEQPIQPPAQQPVDDIN
jgi:hypothetical protein